jgi:hypothetical protein
MMSGDAYHHGRVTNHDPDAFWSSTGSKVWHIVMSPVNLQFDNIGWEDLECEHASSLMTEFCQRCRTHPPVSELTKRPYKSGSLVKTFETAIRRLELKFASSSQGRNIFNVDDIAAWKRMLKNDSHRNFMEGADESDFLKNSFPIHRKNNARTQIIYTDDFPDETGLNLSKEVSMQNICTALFGRESFPQILKLLFTYYGVGRGGEVKFLNYNRWYYCLKFNMLFMQWFQRKTLKSNPSAFAPDYEIPEMSIWLLLGCY